jgi:phospholipid transport system transporter-binding protein
MTFRLPGRVLLDDAALVLQQGAAALAAGEREFDLSDIDISDSSLIACLLAWRRAAQASANPGLAVLNPPERVRGLAALYGVEQIALG